MDRPLPVRGPHDESARWSVVGATDGADRARRTMRGAECLSGQWYLRFTRRGSDPAADSQGL
jgi:hypothetical protein